MYIEGWEKMVETQTINVQMEVVKQFCEKVPPLTLDNIHTIYDLEEKYNIRLKFLNREHIGEQGFYYYLINHKYVLYLYFKQGELKYIAVYREWPGIKKYICERDL